MPRGIKRRFPQTAGSKKSPKRKVNRKISDILNLIKHGSAVTVNKGEDDSERISLASFVSAQSNQGKSRGLYDGTVPKRKNLKPQKYSRSKHKSSSCNCKDCRGQRCSSNSLISSTGPSMTKTEAISATDNSIVTTNSSFFANGSNKTSKGAYAAEHTASCPYAVSSGQRVNKRKWQHYANRKRKLPSKSAGGKKDIKTKGKKGTEINKRLIKEINKEPNPKLMEYYLSLNITSDEDNRSN